MLDGNETIMSLLARYISIKYQASGMLYFHTLLTAL